MLNAVPQEKQRAVIRQRRYIDWSDREQLEPSAPAVLVVPRQLEIANGFCCGEIPAGRMNAPTIKLMFLVQLTNELDLPDHSDKIRAPPMRLKMFV